MAFIDITTNNISRGLRNSSTFIDNWVYVPGAAITGDYSKPLLFESLNDFINTCGDHGPEGTYTHQYVSGLLSAGLPVIFRRIGMESQDNISTLTPEQIEALHKAEKASVTISHIVEETTTNDIKISEKWGGTYGNKLGIIIRAQVKNAYYIDVYYGETLVETKKVCSYTDAELASESTTHTIAKRLIANLPNPELFNKIDIEVLNTNPATFKLNTTSTKQVLSGGTDLDYTYVKAGIPQSYAFISDKLLYQPKYLTSGSFTDADLTTDTAIASAMLNLSRTRQDCRALIDIALGTEAEDYKTQANAIAYTQSSSTEPIPSGMIVGPWCYTQVGNEQLWMPGSFAYLTKVGSDVSQGKESYTPKAGIANGQLSGIIKPQFEIGSDLVEDWQTDGDVQINPIIRLQGGRYIIAGNSTLLKLDDDEVNAFLEASVDMAVLEIRRFVYNLSSELQYQYNSLEAFETFALRTETYLERMMSKGAVTDYQIANVSTADEPRILKIRLDVWVAPTIKSIQINLNIGYGEIIVTTGGEE